MGLRCWVAIVSGSFSRSLALWIPKQSFLTGDKYSLGVLPRVTPKTPGSPSIVKMQPHTTFYWYS